MEVLMGQRLSRPQSPRRVLDDHMPPAFSGARAGFRLPKGTALQEGMRVLKEFCRGIFCLGPPKLAGDFI